MADYPGTNKLTTLEGMTKEKYAPEVVQLIDKFRKIRKQLKRIEPKTIKYKK